MRYYQYISEQKVEMLYSQIPSSSLENIAGKLTIDFKIIKTEFSESPKEKTLHMKILMIEEHLKENKLVGSIEAPNSWFSGTVNMKMGTYRAGLIYFGSDEKTIIGLGGSKINVIGDLGDGHAHSHSVAPYLISALKEELPESARLMYHKMNDESGALTAVELATTQMSGIKQRMEFFAKTLLRYPSNDFEYTWEGKSDKPVILGTPLYIALID